MIQWLKSFWAKSWENITLFEVICLAFYVILIVGGWLKYFAPKIDNDWLSLLEFGVLLIGMEVGEVIFEWLNKKLNTHRKISITSEIKR